MSVRRLPGLGRRALMILLPLGCGACAVEPTTAPTTSPAAPTPSAVDPDWATVASVIGRPGAAHGDTYVVTVPRDDLDVSVEGMAVPTEAGIASEFRFFRCTCGKMRVLGYFVVADYEANDVVDALRQGHMIVSSMGPFLLYERPRLMQVRFQGEDQTQVLAQALREALRWTGKERSAPQTLPAQ